MKKPLALIIMDGFGLRRETEGNAIAAAKHPTLDRLWETCPHTQIGASGLDVGLPDGQMGNSEVGHTNMGAGRIVYQELTRITKSIEDGEMEREPALLHAMENAKKPAACIAISGTCSGFWRWPKRTAWKRCLSTASWTGVTYRRPPGRSI